MFVDSVHTCPTSSRAPTGQGRTIPSQEVSIFHPVSRSTQEDANTRGQQTPPTAPPFAVRVSSPRTYPFQSPSTCTRMIITEEQTPRGSPIMGARVKLIKTGSVSPHHGNDPIGFVNDPYRQFEELTNQLSASYPSVPRPLLVSVLHSTGGDYDAAKALVDQLIATSLHQQHQSGATQNDRTNVTATVSARKRERSIGQLNSVEDQIEAFRKRHRDLPCEIVSFIMDQAESVSNLGLADVALEKIRHEHESGYLNGQSTDGADRHTVALQNATRHAASMALLKNLEAHSRAGAGKSETMKLAYDATVAAFGEYEAQLTKQKEESLDVTKCLSRCVLSQHERLTNIMEKLNGMETKLKEEQEGRDNEKRENDKLKKDCDQLINAVRLLQARVEANERGNNHFFNSFGGPPPGSCY